MESEIKSIGDLLVIIKRRKWDIILPAVSLLLIAVIVAFAVPKKYRSTATILIEAQEIPNEYVRANITTFADQRLQAINQRIMGTPRLLEMINRFGLYADLKSRLTVEEIIARMRKDIKFSTISADVIDPRSGHPAQATIAFSVSYEGKRPEVVQQIANELSSLYMGENLKVREQQSLGTSKFLGEEMKLVQEKLEKVESRISSFKQKNLNSLPELSQVNFQSFEQTDRDIRQLNDLLRTLREKEEYLQSQLANTPPEFSSHEKETISQLRIKLVDLKNKYSDQHPDVIKTKADIKEMEQRLKAADKDSSASRSDNPAYITLASQLAGIRSEIESTKRQISDEKKKRDMFQSRIASSPHVEEGFKALMMERNNLQLKYDDMSRKSMEAKVAHGLEKEQLGERFTLVDPARRPEKPASPNVPAIILIGLVLGLGSGVGLAALKEAGDQAVRNAGQLQQLTGFPVLTTVAEIVTPQDRQRVRKRKRYGILLLVAGVILLLVFVHFVIMDLDILWIRINRKLAG